MSARSKLLSLFLTATATMGAAGLASHANAQCLGYGATVASGTLVPGDTDTGNHADDATTAVTFPFPIQLYGNIFNSGNVSSNGNLQFTTNVTAYVNACLPTATIAGVLLAPHWDDLRTDGANHGVFTSVSGTAPNRIFNIEWRAVYFAAATTELNFEIRLYENGSGFDYVYANVPNNGISATIGSQATGTGPATQFSCNTASLSGVTMIHFACQTSSPPTGVGAATPATAINDGTGTSLFTVTVTPGVNPPSTAHTVVADLSPLGGSTTQQFYDDGTHGDVSANDSVFSFAETVPAGTAAGAKTINFTVTETAPLHRTSNGSFGFTVTTPPTGQCCVSGSCSIQTQADCSTAGGVWGGANTTCAGCACSAGGTPPNDNCANAVLVTVGSTTFGTTCSASVDTGLPTCAGNTPVAPGVWYKVIGTGNTIDANLCASTGSYDTRMSVFCGVNGCGSLTCINSNDDSCGLLSRVTFCSQTGAPYYILVHGFVAASSGSFVLTVIDDGAPCSNSLPCLPTGACCTTTGCTITTSAGCTSLGGHYNGDGSPCSGCAPAGACCTTTGCTTITQAACAAAGGNWRGAGSDCNGPDHMFASDPNLFIPDSPAPAVTDTITVPDTFNIATMTVRVTIPDHTYISDLTVDLVHNGTTVNLWNRSCITDDGLDITFSDAGGPVVCAVGAGVITAGTFMPASPLSVFNGMSSNGAWDLVIQDHVGIDTGHLTHWQLDLHSPFSCGPTCETADFNGDGDVGTDQDIEAFFSCLAGSCCPTCETADFNGDGDVGTDQDIEAFFRVLAGGTC